MLEDKQSPGVGARQSHGCYHRGNSGANPRDGLANSHGLQNSGLIIFIPETRLIACPKQLLPRFRVQYSSDLLFGGDPLKALQFIRSETPLTAFFAGFLLLSAL